MFLTAKDMGLSGFMHHDMVLSHGRGPESGPEIFNAVMFYKNNRTLTDLSMDIRREAAVGRCAVLYRYNKYQNAKPSILSH
jgi:hypothetical protein